MSDGRVRTETLITRAYRPHVDRDDLLAALERETTAFSGVLRSAELTTPVPACPAWDLAALAVHLGGVHRWAQRAVERGELERPAPPELPDRSAVVGWYADAARGLLAALRTAAPGAPAPGFGPDPQTADFWVRRMAHETAVHRWDAERAVGRAAVLDPQLAADGVAEVLEVMLPRQLRLGRLERVPHALALERTDGDGRWRLGDGEPVAAVRADAATLLLLLWRRVHLAPEHVQGDADAAREVLGSALAP